MTLSGMAGSYFPQPVRRVDLPKGDGRTRPLGMPTVFDLRFSISDRIAQTVVQRYLESGLEPVFHRNSYGYRPGRSALDAIAQARRRCRRQDWVVDLDIKSFFDEIDWKLLMKAVRHHADCPWVEHTFDFLGYAFRPRGAKIRSGVRFTSFIPAVGAKAIKAMRAVLRGWKMSHRGDLALEELVKWFQPIVRGWVNDYGRFSPAALAQAPRSIDELVVRWARRKYKRCKRHAAHAWNWLKRLKPWQPALLAHWQLAATVGR